VSVDSLGQVAVDDFAKALFEASKKAKEQGVPFDEKLFAVDYEKSHGPLTTAMQNILDIGHDVSGPVTVVIDKPLSSGGGGSSTGPSALSGPYFESAGGTYGIQMCLANEAGPALDYSLAAQPLLMNTRGGKIFLLQRRNKEALYKPVKPGHGFLGRSTFGHGKKAMQAPVGFIRIKR
jgi:hypothetical protein